MSDAAAAKTRRKRPAPLDTSRAERSLVRLSAFPSPPGAHPAAQWLVKVPLFIAASWQTASLAAEREAARAAAEPTLVAALVPALRLVAQRGELSDAWASAGKAPAFAELLRCGSRLSVAFCA